MVLLAEYTAPQMQEDKAIVGTTAQFAQRVGHLESGDSTPLYRQLHAVLRKAIENGVLHPGDTLPPERELATEYAVSRITLRKALGGLVGEGLLERRQGAGTFVSARVEKHFSTLSSFSEDMRARGRKVHSEWIERLETIASPEEVMALGLSPNSRVYRLRRIRYADNEPMALEYSVIPAFCLPVVDVVRDSLYDALASEGCRPVRALQRLRAIGVDADSAALLQIRAGDAVLLIERRGFLADGRAAELTQSLYRGDRYDFIAELNGAPE